MYTEEDYCKKCGKVYRSKVAIYSVGFDNDTEYKSSYYPFCSARCKREWENGNGYYCNQEFMNEIWNGHKGDSLSILYSKNGAKYKREKDGNWYKISA